ncbi:MAG: hypothetical protein R3E86_05275 [Pseudomonadales bacterium]
MSDKSRLVITVALVTVLATVPATVLLWLYLGPAEPAATASTPGAAQTAPELPVLPVTVPPPTSPHAGAMRSVMPAAAAPGGSGEVTARLGVTVSYAGDSSSLPDSAAVFVFLRAAGQRMPLVVERFAAAELPKTISLGLQGDPASAMEVVARLSLNGDVRLDPDDTEALRALDSGIQPGESLALQIPAAP